MRFIDSEINKMIHKYMASGLLVFEDGGRHAKLRSKRSRDFIPLPGTPSDRRALKNCERSVRRLAQSGEGFIFSKTGRLPTA